MADPGTQVREEEQPPTEHNAERTQSEAERAHTEAEATLTEFEAERTHAEAREEGDDDERDERVPLLRTRQWRRPRGEPRSLRLAALIAVAMLIAGVVMGIVIKLVGDARAKWHREHLSPEARAAMILRENPLIDGHVDLPILVRYLYQNNISAIDLNPHSSSQAVAPSTTAFPGHVDIPRLREGKVGGFFWSVYTPCNEGNVEGENFTGPTFSVRDTLEQIDISRLLIDRYSDDFAFVRTADEAEKAFSQGKIFGWYGVEGAHQLGTSVAVARQYHQLGVKYITLTHTCHNPFADSSAPSKPRHGGLSSLGRSLIFEMNRVGLLVDLSHTSDATTVQALDVSLAPVIFSHSSARAVHDHPRNVPDNILRRLAEHDSAGEVGRGTPDSVIMVNFAPDFIGPGKRSTSPLLFQNDKTVKGTEREEEEMRADIEAVADHVEHVAKVAGVKHVGLGSDFDGILTVPKGLEDVSKFPDLFTILIRRGWSEGDLALLAGGNLLRVMRGAEDVAKRLQAEGTQPVVERYKLRTDL